MDFERIRDKAQEQGVPMELIVAKSKGITLASGSFPIFRDLAQALDVLADEALVCLNNGWRLKCLGFLRGPAEQAKRIEEKQAFEAMRAQVSAVTDALKEQVASGAISPDAAMDLVRRLMPQATDEAAAAFLGIELEEEEEDNNEDEAAE